MLNNRDGSVDKVIISSNDNNKVKLNKKYVLVGYEGNKYVDNFKNSIFGMDIGVNSNGFASITDSLIFNASTFVSKLFNNKKKDEEKM